MSKNLLYCGAHGTLEPEEIKIFDSLGFNVVSTGFYKNGSYSQSNTRGTINIKINQELIDLYNSLQPNPIFTDAIFKKELIDRFDVIIVVHDFPIILKNWDTFKNKIVIFRSVGQPVIYQELLNQYINKGLIVVKVSHKELSSIRRYTKINAPISYKDFDPWIGDEKIVFTCASGMQKFPEYRLKHIYDEVTKDFDRILFGLNNEEISHAKSNVSFEEIKTQLKHSRVAYCTCSIPAPLTYTFVEALAAGCPVVTLGPILSGVTYEQHEYIENGINGFYSDDPQELKKYIRLLNDDYDLAKSISEKGRLTAISNWGPEVVSEHWKNLFKNNKLL